MVNYKLLSLTLLLLVNFTPIQCKSKPIVVTLDTNWKATSYIHEASEFVSEESSQGFWNYVDKIAGLKNPDFGTINSETEYKIALKFSNIALGNQPGSSSEKLLKLALSVHHYSPRVEMYQQMANGTGKCSTIFDVNGKRSCELDEVSKLLQEKTAEQVNIFSKDHVYPELCNSGSKVVVYGDITSKGFYKVHHAIKKIADEGLACYVLRHYVSKKAEEKVSLSGYGVELAIKSTEYKAIDDSKVKENGNENSAENTEDVVVSGFDFKVLSELYPEKSEEISTLRNHLIDNMDEMKPMKVSVIYEIDK